MNMKKKVLPKKEKSKKPHFQKVLVMVNKPVGMDYLLSMEEAALALGYKNRRVIAKLIKDKVLHAVDLRRKGETNNRPRIMKSEIERYIETLKRAA